MFCPKCGVQIEKEQTNCSKCGFNIANVLNVSVDNQEALLVGESKTTSIDSPKGTSIVNTIAFLGIAAVVLIMFFSAASKISEGGLGIMEIQSVGGKTLEEAYYFELGSIYAGYATVTRALGIFFASVLVWLGLKK